MATPPFTCKVCGFTGGPTTISHHYRDNLDHRPDGLIRRHEIQGQPKCWTGRKRSPPKGKTRGKRGPYKKRQPAAQEQGDDFQILCADGTMWKTALELARHRGEAPKFCQHCGGKLP